MTFEVTIDHEVYTFTVVKKPRQRRIVVTAKAPKTFLVTAPKSVRRKDIIDVIQTHQDQLMSMKPPVNFQEAFIDGAQVPIFGEVLTFVIKEGKPQTIRENNTVYFYGINSDDHFKKRVQTWLKSVLSEEINRLVLAYEGVIKGVRLQDVKMRYQYMKTKFGSCQPMNLKMSFNLELVHYPKVFTEYIFLHEMSHLVHANHSHAFYAFFETLCPNHKMYRKAINTYRKTLLNEGFQGLIDRDKVNAI